MKETNMPQLLVRRWIRISKLSLRRKCEKLSTKQRKALVYGISGLYLLCSLVMIAQFFISPKETELPIPKNEYFKDAPKSIAPKERQQLKPIPQLWTRNNKTK